MRRWETLGAALLLTLLFSVVCLAAEPPQVSLTEAFIQTPDERPHRILLEDERLRFVAKPGSTFYFPIENAQRAEDLSGLRAQVRWSKGEEYATAPRIEYRQMYNETGEVSLGYRYVVVLAPADLGAVGTMQGEVKVAKRQNSPAQTVSFTISMRSSEQEGQENRYHCNSRQLLVDFSQTTEWATLDFYNRASFVVSTTEQQQINVGCSIEPLTDFATRYPDAALRFFSWGGKPIFNYEGTLTILGDADEFCYRIIPGGLKDCTDTYSKEAGGFVIQTRSLSEFVVSDRPLDPAAPQQPLPNPPVGARC